MYTRRDAGIYHIGLVIVLFVWICHCAESKTYKKPKESAEPASQEEQLPFSAEFGEFFGDGNAKESGENFEFPKEFSPDFIPYSESRNATRYVNPAETYHAVKDMPGRGREHGRNYKGGEEYRKNEPHYRKEYRKDSYRPKQEDSYSKDETSYRRDDSYRKGGGDNFRKGESYKKGDSYRKDGGYRKSDSYRKEESFRKDEPTRHRNGDREYHKEQSGHRKHESYRRNGDRPSYRKEESSYRKEEPSYKKGDSSYSKPHRDDSDYRKKPIQNLYDDWSPEDDKSSYSDREERTDPESDIEEEEEPEYRDSRDREDEPPTAYKEKGSRKAIPASLRPGPPYYTPSFKVPSEGKGHSSSSSSRHDQAPTPTPQSYYPPKFKDDSKQFQHRKGEPASTKHPQYEKEWAEFRPSPPDPLQNGRSRTSEEYPESDYSSPVAKKSRVATTPLPINRQNCVKLKKMENPPNASGKYVKNMMTCYVCVDDKTGSNYEQCSYESDSKTRPYTKNSEEEESSHSKISHRQKRDLLSIERPKRQKDYYDSSKKKSSYSYNDESYEEKDDVSSDDSSVKDEDEGSAEYDSEDSCYTKKKGDMSCIVCESANKQGSYEKCSYESDPKKSKYETSVDKVYGSPRLPEADSQYNKKETSYGGIDDFDSSIEVPTKSDYSSSDFASPSSSLSRDKSKSSSQLLRGGSFDFGLDGFDFGDLGGEKSSKGFSFGGGGFDFDSIPEPAENEGQFSTKDEAISFRSDIFSDMPKDIVGFDMPKDVDRKMRNDCKKVIRNKMTCYQCVAANGTKQEDCMYVAAAEPHKKHLSYSQIQDFKLDPDSSSNMGTEFSSNPYSKRKFKKYQPDLSDMKFFNKLKEKATMEASRWPRSPVNTVVNPVKISNLVNFIKGGVKKDQLGAASRRSYKRVVPDSEEDEDTEEGSKEEYNSVPNDAPQVNYKGADKGDSLKAAESAWDPKLSISLPRYLTEKSEHETVFDEVLASG